MLQQLRSVDTGARSCGNARQACVTIADEAESQHQQL